MKRSTLIFNIFSLIGLLSLIGCSGRGPQSVEEEQAPTKPPATSTAPAAEIAELLPTASSTATDEPTHTSTPVPVSNDAATQAPSGYPEPATEPAPTGYPDPTQPPTPAATLVEPYPIQTVTRVSYLPAISNNPAPTATPIPPTNTPTPVPTNTPTPIPTLDFLALKQEMNGRGAELVHAKIGFHTGPGGNRTGFSTYMQRLDEAGVPFFLKSVSDTAALEEAQALMKASGVPHVLVFRWAETGYDVPDYSLSPAAAAQKHWDLHMEKWPEVLDKDLVWLETINEVDKERSEWLAEFSLETATLAQANGFKWATFGWSSGEPENSHWQGEKMSEFLRLAAANPDTLAIALHEYSYRQNSIEADAPYLVGRFQSLYQITDGMGIARPTVLITEWGWTYETVPDSQTAIEHIDWANRLYAPYPQVKGAAIWYLGPGYDSIADQAQRLIEPVMIHALTTAYERPFSDE